MACSVSHAHPRLSTIGHPAVILACLEPQMKNKRKGEFRRACRYLGPHKGIVIVSIVCAFVVGIAFTSGLGTLLPIMQVLVKNGTIQDWVNRKIVEHRLDVRLTEDNHEVRLASVTRGGRAAALGLRSAQV